MSKLRYSVTFEVDKELLCDSFTLKSEFNNSWQEFLDWFAKEELGEVITGLDSDPISIKVIDTKSNIRGVK